MPGLLTKETNRNVDDFFDTIQNPSIKEDSKLLMAIMQEISEARPKIWGNERVPDFIIGFGRYTYKQKGSNSELEWFKFGFTPNKDKLTLHLNFNLQSVDNMIQYLGKCKIGKSCLYIRKLADINLDILIQIIDKSFLMHEVNKNEDAR